MHFNLYSVLTTAYFFRSISVVLNAKSLSLDIGIMKRTDLLIARLISTR